MKLPMIMIFQFVTTIGIWAKKALEDGEVTSDEGLELVESLCSIIGVPLRLRVPEPIKEAVDVLIPDADHDDHAKTLKPTA